MKLGTAALLVACTVLMPTAVLADETAKQDLIDLNTITCAQFSRALAYANPGESPTKEAEALAETAQDDLILALTWVNGYLAGRDGAKAENTFNQDWVVFNIGKLSALCKAGGDDMLLTAAVAKL